MNSALPGVNPPVELAELMLICAAPEGPPPDVLRGESPHPTLSVGDAGAITGGRGEVAKIGNGSAPMGMFFCFWAD